MTGVFQYLLESSGLGRWSKTIWSLLLFGILGLPGTLAAGEIAEAGSNQKDAESASASANQDQEQNVEQGSTTSSDQPFSLASRRQIYEQTKKSPSKALLLSLITPGLGNIYVEQYAGAVVAVSVFTFGLVGGAYGVVTDQRFFQVAGGTAMGTSLIGGATYAAIGAGTYNDQLKRRYRLSESRKIRQKTTSIGITLVSFTF
jgi:hypothetical protein